MNKTTLTLERYEWYFFVASYLQNFRRKNSLCKLDRQQPRIASPIATKKIFSFLNFYLHHNRISNLKLILR